MKRAIITTLGACFALIFMLHESSNAPPSWVQAQAQAIPFKAELGAGFSISVTETASRHQITGHGPSLLLANIGSSTAFCRTGSSTVTAGTSDQFMIPDSLGLFTRSTSDTYISCVASAGQTAVILAITGYGA